MAPLHRNQTATTLADRGSAGNVLRWQDANGRARDFYFRNTFDPAGRLVRTDKIKGSPASTPPPDEDRLSGGSGTFETGIVGWESGTLDGAYQFTTGSTYWKAADYAQHPCSVPAAPMPAGEANTKGLWFGKVGVGGPCSYSDAPAGPQVLRKYVSNATRDDVLTFQLWRQVREGSSSLDHFTVYIVKADAATNDMSNRRIAWRMDPAQKSWSRWQRIFDIRPADLFTHAEWPENTTRSVYLLFVFEKSDTITTGINGGLMVDNIFLGRRGVETLVELKYDEPLCASSTPALLSAACEEASQPTDRSTGRLTTITGFHSGVAVDRRRFVYRGMNGRISGEEHAIDWTGTEFLNSNAGSMRWVSRWGYDNSAIATSVVYPHQPGQDYLRRYMYTLDRGRVTGINEGSESIPFLSDSPAPAFDSTGKLLQLKFTNQTAQSFTYDSSNRLKSITSVGPADNGVGTQELWSTGLYRYDPANNITAIGQQQYQYDEASRLVRAEVQPQASNRVLTTEEVVDFRHDPFGNVVSSTPVSGGPMSTDPVGLAFAHNFGTTNRNRIVTDSSGFGFDYDPNGNMQRFRGKLDQTVKAFWSNTNQMTLFYEGDPAVVTSRPGETYLYDASGMRVVRQQVGHEGLPEFDLRAGDGQTLSRFIHTPGNPNPKLDRDYVYGAGMIERVVTSQPPVSSVLHPMITAAAVNLNVNTGAGTYSGDLTTTAGWTNYLPALTADSSGNLSLAESELKTNEVNFLRLKKDGTGESAYSAPIALIVDSGVTSTSPNQVRALAVHRSGNNVTIRWSLLATNNKNFRLYFRRADNNATYTLTPQGLPSTTRTLALDAQALSAPCGSFFVTQLETNGSETAGSAKADLPSPNSGAAGRIPCGGGSGGGPPATYKWLNNFHHRDHLFSLRVLTDESGKRLQGTDFFPYGLELVPDGKTAGALSRAEFTMHDRDEDTGTDDMVLRYKTTAHSFFLSIDPLGAVTIEDPASWNKYSYVRNNPTNAVDPLGLSSSQIPGFCDVENPDCGAGGGSGSGWVVIGYSQFLEHTGDVCVTQNGQTSCTAHYTLHVTLLWAPPFNVIDDGLGRGVTARTRDFTARNHCRALVALIHAAADLYGARDSAHPNDGANQAALAGLKAMVIGDGYFSFSGRNKGADLFTGWGASGTSYKSGYSDPFNQNQHALGGLEAGYWSGGFFKSAYDSVQSHEAQPQDRSLNAVTMPLGNQLAAGVLTLDQLADLLADRVCQ